MASGLCLCHCPNRVTPPVDSRRPVPRVKVSGPPRQGLVVSFGSPRADVRIHRLWRWTGPSSDGVAGFLSLNRLGAQVFLEEDSVRMWGSKGSTRVLG